jgi:hypothetical protein
MADLRIDEAAIGEGERSKNPKNEECVLWFLHQTITKKE